MELCSTIAEIRSFVQQKRMNNESVALVPTMGNLHEGHLSLIRTASKHADHVVVSVFVNPTQFGPGEDLDTYPRTPEQDMAHCKELGVAAVFMPDADEVYLSETHIGFSVGTMGDYLCGASREGHFEGVLQIVNKLFNIVQPHVAVFGAKDIQQVTIIERMVKELNIPIEIVRGETIREEDGLALSSRNQYLSKEERERAPALYNTLSDLSSRLRNNRSADIETLLNEGRTRLEENGMKIDYLNLVEAETLQLVSAIERKSTYILAAAVFLGSTRLIDNIQIQR